MSATWNIGRALTLLDLPPMGNLGKYEEITRDAARAGGVDNWIAAIESAAAGEATRRTHKRDALVGLGLAVVVGGLFMWGKFKAREIALSEQRAAAAKDQLKAVVTEADSEPDEGPNESDRDSGLGL